jgi:hypothetical protein
MRTLRPFFIAGGLAMLGGYLIWLAVRWRFERCPPFGGGCLEPEGSWYVTPVFVVGVAISVAWPAVLAKLLGSLWWWARGIVALVIGGLGTWLVNWPLWAATDSFAAVAPVALGLVAGIAAPLPHRAPWAARVVVLILAAGLAILSDLSDPIRAIGWFAATGLVIPGVGVADLTSKRRTERDPETERS